jgi:hypothetical protein
MRKVLSGALALLLPSTALAAHPQTLWELTWSSELVVLARVLAPVSPDPEGDIVWLEVEETLKGAGPASIELALERGRGAPPLRKLEPGRQVIAFLSFSNGRWRLVGEHDALRRVVGAEDAAELSVVVRGTARLQSKGRAVRPPPAPESWVALAFSSPASRWDALFALDPRTDPRAVP